MEEMKRYYAPKLQEIFGSIQSRESKGIEMTGWIPWVFEDHSEIFKKADEIKNDWKVYLWMS